MNHPRIPNHTRDLIVAACIVIVIIMSLCVVFGIMIAL